MAAEHILSTVESPELDYVYLTSLLRNYSRPRQEISRLLKKGALIRVKKGLYVAPELAKRPYSKEILANLIYGPSYVSLDYALRFHGLTPERVEELTSVTCNRNKTFDTPVGRFSYRYLSPSLFPLAVTLANVGEGRHFLVATPEKALIDKIWFHGRNLEPAMLPEFLFEDLRIDPKALKGLHLGRLTSTLSHYQDAVFLELVELVRAEKGKS